jgi:cytosine deaminase
MPGFDLVLRNVRIAGREEDLVDIGIEGGRIAAIGAGLPAGTSEQDCSGRLATAGFVDTHIHLDKSCLLERCNCDGGSFPEAVAAVAKAKRGFTEEDIYERAKATLEKAILRGTTYMRTHVEVDPRIGLMGLRALRRLKHDYAWAIDLELCVFPQEGLLDDPGCEAVLAAALEEGGDLVGGAPYMDRDSHGQIARIFALARHFDVDIDFHLDFSLDPSHLDAVEVCRLAALNGWPCRARN